MFSLVRSVSEHVCKHDSTHVFRDVLKELVSFTVFSDLISDETDVALGVYLRHTKNKKTKQKNWTLPPETKRGTCFSSVSDLLVSVFFICSLWDQTAETFFIELMSLRICSNGLEPFTFS